MGPDQFCYFSLVVFSVASNSVVSFSEKTAATAVVASSTLEFLQTGTVQSIVEMGCDGLLATASPRVLLL